MPIRPIVRLGHPALRYVADPVAPEEIAAGAIQELIDDMIATMRAAHGVGLAAPQVAAPVQIFVYEVAPLPAGSGGDDESVENAQDDENALDGEDGAGAAGSFATDEDFDDDDFDDEEDGEGEEDEGDGDDEDEAGDEGEDGEPFDEDAEGEPQAPIALRVVINPMLTPLAGDPVYDWEGCLSIPDLRGLVPRHPEVRVRGLDRHGQSVDFVVSGFEARIVQHEFDHLNGVVFLDRMGDFKALAYREEWERYMAPRARRRPSAEPPAAAPPTPGSIHDPDPI